MDPTAQASLAGEHPAREQAIPQHLEPAIKRCLVDVPFLSP
jgi:hypothetical protein